MHGWRQIKHHPESYCRCTFSCIRMRPIAHWRISADTHIHNQYFHSLSSSFLAVSIFGHASMTSPSTGAPVAPATICTCRTKARFLVETRLTRLECECYSHNACTVYNASFTRYLHRLPLLGLSPPPVALSIRERCRRQLRRRSDGIVVAELGVWRDTEF